MAFPTIPTVAAGRLLSNTQADGSATRTFPSLSGLTKNSGDLLIAICVVYQSSAAGGAVFSGWGAGFTEFLDVGGTTSNMSIGAAYKISTGSETGTFTVTQAATVTGHAAMFLMSIPGAHPTTAPVGGTIVNGTAAAANIAALDPSTWGTLDTLWIAVGGSGETGTSGAYGGLDAAPTNYTTGFLATGISADVVGGVEAGVGFRQLNAASDDPGTFTVDTSNARNSAVLLAICPAPTSVTITTAQETNTAEVLSATLAPALYDLTPATETDLVGEIVPLQPLPATETVSAPQISTQSGHNLTTATETASAQALNVDKAVTITLAAETDLALSSQLYVGAVSETDSAEALVVSQAADYSLTLVTETDLVGEIVPLQTLPAETTASAQALDYGLAVLDLVVDETDEALILSFTSGGGHLIVAATETDLANSIIALQPLPATETVSVQALDLTLGGRAFTYVTETDSARSLGATAGVSLTQYEATAPLPYNLQQVTIGDTSTAVELTFSFGVGANKTITPATETDRALTSGSELLPNTSFEDSPGDAHWDTFGAMSMQPRAYGATTYPVPVLSGNYVLQAESNSFNAAIITEPDEWIAVTPGATYTLEAWFWSPVTLDPGIGVNPYTASLALVGSSARQTTIPANTWTKLSHSFTLSSTAVWVQVSLYLWANTPKEFYIDSVSLKRDGGAISISKPVPLPLVTSTATAPALTQSKSYSTTTATSIDTAQPLVVTLDTGTYYSIDPALSTETATQLSILKEIFVTLGIVVELDLARLTRAANRPSGGLALIDHEALGELIMIDHLAVNDLALIDIVGLGDTGLVSASSYGAGDYGDGAYSD